MQGLNTEEDGLVTRNVLQFTSIGKKKGKDDNVHIVHVYELIFNVKLEVGKRPLICPWRKNEKKKFCHPNKQRY